MRNFGEHFCEIRVRKHNRTEKGSLIRAAENWRVEATNVSKIYFYVTRREINVLRQSNEQIRLEENSYLLLNCFLTKINKKISLTSISRKFWNRQSYATFTYLV